MSGVHQRGSKAWDDRGSPVGCRNAQHAGLAVKGQRAQVVASDEQRGCANVHLAARNGERVQLGGLPGERGVEPPGLPAAGEVFQVQAAQLVAVFQQLVDEGAAHAGQVAEAQGCQVAREEHQAGKASISDQARVLQ